MLTGTCRCRIRDFHPLWSDFPDCSAIDGFVTPQCFRNPGLEFQIPNLRISSADLEREILARFGLCPLSLAATDGMDVSFFSSRYLDVSVPWVRFQTPMNSAPDDPDYSGPRFRIQKSPDRRSFASFPELIAGYHVFRRLSMPRHPPYTLSSLTTFIEHYLKTRDWKLKLQPLISRRACR